MAGVWGRAGGGTVTPVLGCPRGTLVVPRGEWSISYRVRLLAVDTTTPRGSLALLEDDEVRVEVRREAAEGHSRWLLPAVADALEGLGVTPAQIDGFAVTVGPGSFTGLRVGIATVQGLALAAGRRVVGMSSLDVLALGAAGEADTVVALLDAFRGEVFAGVFDGGETLRGARRVGPVEGVLDGLKGPVAFVGEGALRYRDRIEARVPGARFPAVDLFLATRLGRAAMSALRRGETTPPAEIRPLYLRGADARPSRS